MPLLGKNIFVSVKPLKDNEPGETVYTVPHSKEQFRSQAEFKKRTAWYDERIWTCRCTGHTNLTHQEAWNSEKIVKKSLKQQFPACHQKPVLELVHHSIVPLDNLVDQAWLMLQQVLTVGESVSLKVKTAGKLIKGRVIKVNKAGVAANPTSNSNSPSSDKENSAEDCNGSPKKWMPPKLLQYRYSLRLDDEEKVINEIPAADISRLEKPPSKELVRFFIRANALRVGQNQTSPWVVDESWVKEFSLPSKFASFLLSPIKMAEITSKSEEEPNSKKRKLSLSSCPPSKKAKIDKISSAKKNKHTDKKKQTTLTGTTLKKSTSTSKIKSSEKRSPKKSPKKYKTPELVEILSDSSTDDEDCPLSKLQVSPSKSTSLSKSPRKSLSLNKEKKNSSLNKEKKSSSRSKKEKKKSMLKKDEKKSPRKYKKSSSEKKSEKKNTPKKGVRGLDSDEDQPLAKLKKSPKKNLKQMTLFDMSKKKGLKTPEKRRSTTSGQKTPERKKVMSPPRTPAIVSKMVQAHKKEDHAKLKLFVQQAAKILTSSQMNRLPPEIKATVVKRAELIAEKKKLNSMTPEQRIAYLKEKHEKRKALRKERQLELKQKNREKMKEMNKKYEDQTLVGKPLPAPKLVSTPDGLPNEVFGDVALITEFINCYSGLLMPEESYPILTDALMKAISSGSDGFTYLSRALVVLLQTLLQDEISEDYQEIKVPLSDIPVNALTASELTRLCLRQQDEGGDDEEDGDNEVSGGLIQMLESQELYQLEPVQKVQIIKGLCLRIMATYSVQDYMEEKQTQLSNLWKKRMAHLKVKNVEKKKEKQIKKEKAEQTQKEEKPANDDKVAGKKEGKDEKEPNLMISHFYGKSSGNQSESSKPATPEPTSAESTEEADDLASIVRRRRHNVAKVAAEKEQRQYETRLKREKEYEEYRKQKQQEDVEKQFTDGIALAKTVLRQTPIGTDRNHSRYWLFSGVTPGLFIEKGWVNEDIDYFIEAEENDSSDSEDSEISFKTVNKGDEDQNIESSVPHFGQNLWFTYDSVKDLDNLIANLHVQGYRESKLKEEIQKRYTDITKGIIMAKRTNNELRDSNGDKEMLEGFRKELSETEVKLRYGGLGGVEEFEVWETKLATTTELSDFGKLMVKTQESVTQKFRQGIMVLKKKKAKVAEVTDVKEEKEEEEEEEVEEVKGIVDWREAAENATTLSRLHVLLGILDTSIKWEKSAENAKCKICRKMGEDVKLLLCDECNQPFHMYCLRPALSEIPKGDWFCVSCTPLTQRRRPRYINDSESSDGDEEIEHEDNCAECGGDEGLIFCDTCPTAYHLECHDPPLRHPPRGRWICNECKTGTNRKSRSRTKRNIAKKTEKAPAKRKRYVQESEESEDEKSEESSEEEEMEDPSWRQSVISGKVGRKTQRKSHEDDDNEPPKKVSRKKQDKTQPKSPKSKRGRKPGSTNKEKASPETSPTDGRTFKSRRAPSGLSICELIVGDVMKMESSWPFLNPVSKKEVPDYHRIVKHPMDLQLVKDKLRCMVYGSVEEVIEDVKQIFINAEIYNKAGSEVLDCKDEVEKTFASLVKKNLPLCLYARGKNNHC